MSTSSPLARRRPLWLILLAASLPMFMATLDNLVMTNALPVLHAELGASVEELQWFVNAYTLAFASTILLAVALGDRYGRRTVFLIGIALFTASSAFAALSTDPTGLIVARALQGLGGAGVMPLSLALLAGSVSTERRPLAIGIWGGISGLGVAVGPLVGGAVVEGWNWQAIFWLNVPVGIVSLVLAAVALPNTFGARVRADYLGTVLAGAGTLGLIYGIVRGNDAGWTSAEVLIGLVGGGLLLALFLVWQTRAASPLLPLRLFRDRSFTVANLTGFGFSFGVFGSIFLLIQFLQVVQSSSPFEAALQTTPWTLAPMVVAPLAGIFGSRVGTRTLIVAGLTAQAVGLGWIALVMTPDVAYSSLIAPFLVAGIGMGLVFAPSATAVLATLPGADHAKASGANSTIREIGVALGIAVLTAIFTGSGGDLVPDAYVEGAVPAVLVGAAVVLAAAGAGLALPRRGAGRKQETATAAATAATEDVLVEV